MALSAVQLGLCFQSYWYMWYEEIYFQIDTNYMCVYLQVNQWIIRFTFYRNRHW